MPRLLPLAANMQICGWPRVFGCLTAYVSVISAPMKSTQVSARGHLDEDTVTMSRDHLLAQIDLARREVLEEPVPVAVAGITVQCA